MKELGIYKAFNTIYADPPWSENQKGKLGAINHYDLMTLERIKEMPINYLASENSLLFLWIPPSLMEQGIEVIKNWGYRYIDEMIWKKPYFRLGKRVRHQHESLLLGVKGNPPVKFRGQGSVVEAPLQEHSHKPEEFFSVIERISHEPYLELFARRQPTTNCRANWSVWGNEIDSDIYIPGYPVPEYSERASLPSPEKRAEIEKTDEEGA